MFARAAYEDDGESATNQYAILFPWFVQGLGVIVLFALTQRESRLPYVACMFALGTIMGGLAQYTDANDQLTRSILQWRDVDSQVLLLVFLPGLIFRDAIEVNFQLFTVAFWQILVLAFPMVLVGTFLTTVCGYFLFPFGWTVPLSAILGSILSSTDPVAVAAVLKQAGAPPRLQMHIAGESLINDGSAVVFFTIFRRQFMEETLGVGEAVDWGSGFGIFFRMALGGVLVGFMFALGLLLTLYVLDRRLEPEYDVLQVAAALTFAYVSYYVSEQVCDMSGIVACVVCGITARGLGQGLINDEKLMDSYLKLMEHILNTLLFTLGGVVWGGSIANLGFSVSEWMYLVLLYALIMVIRVFQVGLFYPLFSSIGLQSNWKEAVFLSYGGLRGAVGIALALSLNRSVIESTEDENIRRLTSTVEFMAGGVAFLTLFVNGTFAGLVLKYLGLVKPAVSRKQAMRLFSANATAFLQKEYNKLGRQARFKTCSIEVIKSHVPYAEDLEILDNFGSLDSPGHVPRDSFQLEQSQSTRFLSNSISCSDDAVVETRQLFVELLNEAYAWEAAKGELDEKEDHGFNLKVLHETIEFANTDLNTPLHDWDDTKRFQFGRNAKELFHSRFWTQMKHDKQDFTYQQNRIEVLRAIAFIHAHSRAETKLQNYVDSMTDVSMHDHDQIDLAVHQVLEESHKQVEKARECLKSHWPEIVDTVTAHYLCSILLNRLSQFVQKNATDGVLRPKEGRKILEKIERRLEEVHSCSCKESDAKKRRRTRVKTLSLNSGASKKFFGVN